MVDAGTHFYERILVLAYIRHFAKWFQMTYTWLLQCIEDTEYWLFNAPNDCIELVRMTTKLVTQKWQQRWHESGKKCIRDTTFLIDTNIEWFYHQISSSEYTTFIIENLFYVSILENMNWNFKSRSIRIFSIFFFQRCFNFNSSGVNNSYCLWFYIF